MIHNIEHRQGFTLVEMLVVTAIFVSMGILLATSLFSIMKSNTKAELMKNIRQNGSYALAVMGRMIANGTITSNNCSAANTSIIIENPDGEETTFGCRGDPAYIASNSAQLTDNQSIKVENCNVFTCKDLGGYKKVTINFTLQQAGSSPRPEDQASQDFQKVILVRNK